jgi:exodeoxyribonuclease VII small subunit
MESGELSLDESLQAFERGIKLTRQCQEALAAAELKVQMLTEQGDLEDIEYETE